MTEEPKLTSGQTLKNIIIFVVSMVAWAFTKALREVYGPKGLVGSILMLCLIGGIYFFIWDIDRRKKHRKDVGEGKLPELPEAPADPVAPIVWMDGKYVTGPNAAPTPTLKPMPSSNANAIAGIIGVLIVMGILGSLVVMYVNNGAERPYADRPTSYYQSASPPPVKPHPAKVGILEYTDPRIKGFKLGEPGNQHTLSIRIPKDWKLEASPENPALLFIAYPIDPKLDLAYLNIAVLEVGVHLDAWEIADKEDSEARFNKSKPGSNAKLFSREKIQLCGQHAVRVSSEYTDKGIPLRLRNHFLWPGTLMITVSLQTEGENREATLAAYQKVYDEAVATLTIDDVAATTSAIPQRTATTQPVR